MNRKNLGVFIATSRDDANMTQARLGEAMEVGGGTVHRWERGTILIPWKRLGALADVLGLTGASRDQLYELWAAANEQETQEEQADLRQENAEMRQELRNALAELRRFSDTYQSFHAAYQRIEEQVDRIIEEQKVNQAERDIIKDELAEIKQAVLRLRPPRRGSS